MGLANAAKASGGRSISKITESIARLAIRCEVQWAISFSFLFILWPIMGAGIGGEAPRGFVLYIPIYRIQRCLSGC